MKRYLTIGMILLFNVSCATKEIVPDTSRWNSYCSEVVDYLICYKLPGNFKEIIAPKRKATLTRDSDGYFGYIFSVGYDYHQSFFNLPKFRINMMVYKFNDKLTRCDFNEFSNALASHYNRITKNSTNPSNSKSSDWEKIEVNGKIFARHISEKSESYYLLIGNKYFITIGSTYGMYSNVSSKWKIEREKIFNNIINSISLKKTTKLIYK